MHVLLMTGLSSGLTNHGSAGVVRISAYEDANPTLHPQSRPGKCDMMLFPSGDTLYQAHCQSSTHSLYFRSILPMYVSARLTCRQDI